MMKTKKYLATCVVVLTLTLTSCAQKFPKEHPSINTTYKGNMTITASLTPESLMNRVLRKESSIDQDVTIHDDIANVEVNWGSASRKDAKLLSKENSLARSKNNTFKSQGSIQMSHNGGYFQFTSNNHGEYKLSIQKICSFTSNGKGSVYSGNMSEHGDISFICNGETYKGIFLYHGEDIAKEQ